MNAGTRIGPYEVLSALGAGGMGEVYRARDARLGRDVALKILPADMAADPERLARFTREARVLASLNHPRIGAIYGVEDGSLESGIPIKALVLELVDGPTLADLIAAGASDAHGRLAGDSRRTPLPMMEALAIARQIADALEEAHERGIIHRDLKPANIKVRDDGSVKVLDFGLARLTEGPPRGGHYRDRSVRLQPDFTATPTLTSPALMTGAGMILGTAAYMSPEQARGKDVDVRADVWAFGCVLYEMLTGKRAFPGEDVTETIAAVVKDEPDWSALPRDVPPTVRVYLRRCLAKSPRERVGSIADVRLALEGAFDVTPTTVGLAAAPIEVTSRRRAVLAGLALAAMAAAAAVAWIAKPVAEPPPAPVRRYVVDTGTTASLGIANNNRDLAITPDGDSIVYFAGQGAQRRLYLRRLDSLMSIEVHEAGSFFEPFVSPDGKWIAFNDETDFTLRKIAVSGGAPASIAAIGREILGATWGADDTIVFATNEGGTGLWRVPASGGTPTVLTTPDKARGEVAHLWPEFLPDGETLVYTIRSDKSSDEFEIAGLDLATKQPKRLGLMGTSPRFSSSGHLVYSVGQTLSAVRFDPARLEVLGEPVPVADGVLAKSSGGTSFALAREGTLTYVSGVNGSVGRRLILSDRKGERKVLKAPERAYTIPRFSPDGRRVAVDLRDQQNDIWVWDLERETLTRLTFESTIEQVPMWTPDGKRVVFSSARGGSPNLFWQAADGTGSPERLTESSNVHYGLTFTPDGSRLLFRREGTGEDVLAVSMDGSHPVAPLLQTPFNERNAAISPDGSWLAYQSNESGSYEIYVRPFPALETGRWQVSSGGGIMPTWAGRELFYVAADSTIVSTTVTSGASFAFSKPQMVVPAGFFIAPSSRSYDVSPDGTRFLLIDTTGQADGPKSDMVVVLNWGQELRRILPPAQE